MPFALPATRVGPSCAVALPNKHQTIEWNRRTMSMNENVSFSLKMFLAILLGNLAYFLIAPYLPDAFAHNIFEVDAGLLFDMAICAAVYLLVRKVV